MATPCPQPHELPTRVRNLLTTESRLRFIQPSPVRQSVAADDIQQVFVAILSTPFHRARLQALHCASFQEVSGRLFGPACDRGKTVGDEKLSGGKSTIPRRAHLPRARHAPTARSALVRNVRQSSPRCLASSKLAISAGSYRLRAVRPGATLAAVGFGLRFHLLKLGICSAVRTLAFLMN